MSSKSRDIPRSDLSAKPQDSSTPLGMTAASKPRRQLGLFDATMIVMGGIVGAGIFANPSEVAHRVHTPFLILGVWVLGGLLAMCGAFIWAELATRLPGAAGGQYVYLREAYHPAVGFVYGWGLLLRNRGDFRLVLSRAHRRSLERKRHSTGILPVGQPGVSL